MNRTVFVRWPGIRVSLYDALAITRPMKRQREEAEERTAVWRERSKASHSSLVQGTEMGSTEINETRLNCLFVRLIGLFVAQK